MLVACPAEECPPLLPPHAAVHRSANKQVGAPCLSAPRRQSQLQALPLVWASASQGWARTGGAKKLARSAPGNLALRRRGPALLSARPPAPLTPRKLDSGDNYYTCGDDCVETKRQWTWQ